MCVKNVLSYYCCSELLVDFDHEHGIRGDFECLRPRQNLLDVVSIYLIYINECFINEINLLKLLVNNR